MSMAAASSSSAAMFFGLREEEQKQLQMNQQQHSSAAPTSSTAPSASQPSKKKRNLPGTPSNCVFVCCLAFFKITIITDPDAEVIALSPKTLMATNRFICEVCNKGFQREQNLQLHRRGHNLPWKLRQKTTKEVKRKVYLCPEPTCVHHDPSRALGDLTGIKKHYSRKHGEKKWKCDKCSKRYAVHSDWKAHSKTCGTREYRCDCGTLFSRRDSFITHRAFCDALAQESARHPTNLNTIGSHLYGNSNIGIGLSQVGSHLSSLQDHQPHSSASDILRLGGASRSTLPQFDHHLLPPSSISSSLRPQQSIHSSAFYIPEANQDYHDVPNKPFHGLMHLPDLQSNPTPSAANLFNLSFLSNSNASNSATNTHSNTDNENSSSSLLFSSQFTNGSMMSDSLFSTTIQQENIVPPQMSATALLQKAAQLGSTTSNNNNAGGAASASLLRGFGSTSSCNPKSANPSFGVFLGENENNLQDLMNSLAGGNSSIFSTFGGNNEQGSDYGGFNTKRSGFDEGNKQQQIAADNIGVSDRLTRDFLGVGEIVRSMSSGFSQRDQQQSGLDPMSSLDSEDNNAPRF
ncbi:Zinc finger, double-stranded RNA binding [Dillenia turbinata]|uniref:Zinc finger, double-stranded RNA binding n=1 Tax=Dillenia turbinata TaxID=194707 RepID=A0AAN8VQZ0_9MAGN